MTLWLDDIRNPIAYGCLNADWVKTVDEFKSAWQTGKYSHMSLDHDLGACETCMGPLDPEEWLVLSGGLSMPHCPHVGTGYDVVCWLEANPELWPIAKPEVHSSNPVGSKRMLDVINRFYK